MHDDAALTVERVRRVLVERVEPAIYATSVPFAVHAHELPGEPIAPAEALDLTYTATVAGSAWGPAWGTTWFRLAGEVPASWAGRQIHAVIDLGFDHGLTGFQCEALVYRPDGSPVKALNPRNQWVPVEFAAAGGEHVELYLEAASNPILLGQHPFRPTPQGDIKTSSSDPLYRLRRLDLAVFDAEVHELALDLDVLFGVQAELSATAPRRMRILQALDDALDALDLQDISGTAETARQKLAAVLAAPAEQSAHKIAAIGHSHIDSAWLWPVRETIRKVARTTSSMTELLESDPDFQYGMSSAQQYAWLKQHRPEVWERVRAAVADGRFHPLGGMWVESDTVLPSGESLVRQFSHGQRFFETEFGIRSRGVWLPDSFGYSPALPQLMRRAGFEWFFTQKISWNQQNVFPHHSFLWEGIDGSQVFTHFPPMDTYSSELSGSEVAKAARQFRESRKASSSIAPVGWGDGGGGTTREMLGRAKRMRNLEGSPRVQWQHPNDFFDEMKAELARPDVWVGELYLELHRGTLTSQHATKARHRRAEQALIQAEIWATTAAIRTGLTYPLEDLDRLWKGLLLQEFHDILPGTSIAWVHREAVAALDAVIVEANEISRISQHQLVGDGGQHIVFSANSLSAQRPLGAVFTEPRVVRTQASQSKDGFVLENELVRVLISPEGLVTSAIDLASGREAIPAGAAANLLQLHQDFPNMWDAWDIDRFYRNNVTNLTEATAIHLEDDENGPRIVVDRDFSASRITQTLTLDPGSRTLRISNVIDWHETEKLLKLAFPLDIRATHTEAETQFGYQSRVTHTNTSWEAAKFETSMHRFVLVREADFGVALVNDSIYGYDTSRDVEGDDITTTVRLSLLRAPRFPDPDTDHGSHEIEIGFVIGADAETATAEGIALNTPPTMVTGGCEVEPLVSVEGKGIIVSAVKLADDGSDDVIVRVYEALGARATGSLGIHFAHSDVREVSLIEDALPDARTGTALSLNPFEVRTIRIVR